MATLPAPRDSGGDAARELRAAQVLAKLDLVLDALQADVAEMVAMLKEGQDDPAERA